MFIWTLHDVLGLVCLAALLLVFACVVVSDWWHERKRNK